MDAKKQIPSKWGDPAPLAEQLKTARQNRRDFYQWMAEVVAKNPNPRHDK